MSSVRPTRTTCQVRPRRRCRGSTRISTSWSRRPTPTAEPSRRTARSASTPAILGLRHLAGRYRLCLADGAWCRLVRAVHDQPHQRGGHAGRDDRRWRDSPGQCDGLRRARRPPVFIRRCSIQAGRRGSVADRYGGQYARFNVYRQQQGRRVRVNRRLLPALGGASGHAYSFTDRHAARHRAIRYWLQDVSTSGQRTWHGPVRVAAS